MQLDGKELPLWPFDHLSQVEKKNLSTKALDLRERIKAVPQLHAKYATTLRTGGESITTIRWVLQVQADLLTGSGRPTSIQDFGHPPDSAASASSVYDGNLPSIKKTQEAIKTEVSAFKKGPGMHDSGGEKSDIFK